MSKRASDTALGLLGPILPLSYNRLKAGAYVAIDNNADQLKQLVRKGKETGYVVYDEIDELLPPDYAGGPELDDILSELAGNGIEILEDPTIKNTEGISGDEELLDEIDLREAGLEPSDLQALHMYLREVVTIPHLTREEEIDLAERISRGPDPKTPRSDSSKQTCGWWWQLQAIPQPRLRYARSYSGRQHRPYESG